MTGQRMADEARQAETAKTVAPKPAAVPKIEEPVVDAATPTAAQAEGPEFRTWTDATGAYTVEKRTASRQNP